MATVTLGTAGTTTLTALAYDPSAAAADIAAICNAILDDQNVANPIWPGAFVQAGLLYVPNRGVLRVLPGDYVAVDPTAGIGWPILVSAEAAAAAGWVHS